MVFKNLWVSIALWMKVASVLEGLRVPLNNVAMPSGYIILLTITWDWSMILQNISIGVVSDTLNNISPLHIFPIMLSPKMFHQNYQAVVNTAGINIVTLFNYKVKNYSESLRWIPTLWEAAKKAKPLCKQFHHESIFWRRKTKQKKQQLN